MHKILIVEDDDFIRKVTKGKLEAEGYHILEAVDRVSLLKQLEQHGVQILLLDIVLNKDNGIELIGEVREHTDAPIIMVSSKDHLFDKIVALEMGADDYMTKPVEPKELVSRIKAHIRRYVGNEKTEGSGTKSKETIRFGPWVIDHKSYSVKNDNGDDAGLTKDEFDLLVTLAKSPNVVFSRDRLFEILKADNFDSFDRSIDIQVTRIRKKLGDDARNPSIIKTVRKVGYTFVANTDKTQ